MGVLLLVRHGQASWGAADYDVLSETGWEQSRLLGEALAARGVVPDRVVRGAMRRHRETAEGIGRGTALPEAEVDAGWDEFDSEQVLAHVPAPWAEDATPSRAEFQEWFERSMARWTSGDHAGEYTEPFADFGARVEAALARVAERPGTTLVVTSGGPISWCLAALLGADLDDVGRAALSQRFNPVCTNTGVTKLVTGRRGTTVVSINEHTHLEPTPELLTYR